MGMGMGWGMCYRSIEREHKDYGDGDGDGVGHVLPFHRKRTQRLGGWGWGGACSTVGPLTSTQTIVYSSRLGDRIIQVPKRSYIRLPNQKYGCQVSKKRL